MRGNRQVVDLKQMSGFMASPQQLVCLWILHIKTAVREMKIKAEFAKLTIERRLNECLNRTYCASAFSSSCFPLLLFLARVSVKQVHQRSTVQYCLTVFFFDISVNQWTLHCLWTHKFHFLSIFSLKNGLTVLFTHLKIILLQYFQFNKQLLFSQIDICMS